MSDRIAHHRSQLLPRLRARSREVALAMGLTFAALVALGLAHWRDAEKRVRAPMASAAEPAVEK